MPLLVAVLAACSAPPEPRGAEEIGSSVRGRPIEARVFPGRRPAVLFIAGIHGDEPAGSALLDALAVRLDADPAARKGREVAVIARANPDGLRAGTRGNEWGIDVNRNFPARNFSSSPGAGRRPLSTPEARMIFQALGRWRPGAVISVHGPLACIDPDGGEASAAIARRMAATGTLPIKDLEPLPGSLGSYAGVDRGFPMVTYELERKDLPRRDADTWLARHLEALLAAIDESQDPRF